MSEAIIEEQETAWDIFQDAMKNFRLDTAMRSKGARRALDVRDDTIESLMKVAVLLGGAIDEVMTGIEARTMTLKDAYKILKEADQEVGELEKIIENRYEN